MENIGLRIEELMDYLGLSPHEFATRCGISTGHVITSNISGEYNPSMTTINRILKRYPVNNDWLLCGNGNMFKTDYFTERFEALKAYPKTPQMQIEILLNVFEMNARQFCIKTKVGTCTLSAIKNGQRIEVSKKVRDLIVKKYPFIPQSYFYF